MLIAVIASGQCAADNIAKLHQSAIVIDTHSDFLDRTAIDGARLNEDPPFAQTTLKKLVDGQIDAQFFSVFVPPAFEEYGFAKRTLELIDRFYAEIEDNPTQIRFAQSAADIRNLSQQGYVAALLGIEGGHSIENSLELLRIYHRLGVRYLTLTWNNTNEWADSSSDEAIHNGLNEFGVAVVREMNDLGMLIDISHVSDDTFWDVIESSRAPIIASHSLARTIKKSSRNMSDDMIKALAVNGGVIQVSFYAKHLDERFSDEFDTAMAQAASKMSAIEKQFAHAPIAQDMALWSAEKELERSLEPPPMTRVIDHIDHIVGIAGIDHVGLGSDFDGLGAPPAGLAHSGEFQSITRELVARGYNEPDIKKILGGNFLRVFEAAQSKASQGSQ